MGLAIHSAPPVKWGWLIERTGCAISSDFRAIEALDGTGRTRGMVGFCNWTPNAVQAHMAVESPMVWRWLLSPALEYAFVDGRRNVLVGIIAANNEKSRRFFEHVGAWEAGVIEDGHAPGVDLSVYQLLKRHCRYLPQRERAT